MYGDTDFHINFLSASLLLSLGSNLAKATTCVTEHCFAS